jgi:hypothetical protein
VLVICLEGRLELARPSKPLEQRRDLGVIHVRIVATAGADELEPAGVAAFDAAVHDASWLTPYECRPAMAGLPDKREYHADDRPHAQPRVTAIVWTQRRDCDWTDTRSGAGHGVRVTRSAHSAHRQNTNSCAAGVWSSMFAVLGIRYTQALRGEMPSPVGQCLMRLYFLAVCLSVE